MPQANLSIFHAFEVESPYKGFVELAWLFPVTLNEPSFVFDLLNFALTDGSIIL